MSCVIDPSAHLPVPEGYRNTSGDIESAEISDWRRGGTFEYFIITTGLTAVSIDNDDDDDDDDRSFEAPEITRIAMTSEAIDVKSPASDAGHVEYGGVDKAQAHHVDIQQQHPEMYLEALIRYPNDESIDQAEEKRLVRKLDMRILPLLGICYFFYYVDKTTLRKERRRGELRAAGNDVTKDLNATGFTDLTDKENPNFVYVY
ncbi:major facilitator superfamily domain-containing protein [Apiospora aurea]|uniref:Major facilitator superfamily domain-containing protein n=1 Tax=Apiospora aurea TaxID=335848 RepID=A0ABR1QB56_9PEZI